MLVSESAFRGAKCRLDIRAQDSFMLILLLVHVQYLFFCATTLMASQSATPQRSDLPQLTPAEAATARQSRLREISRARRADAQPARRPPPPPRRLDRPCRGYDHERYDMLYMYNTYIVQALFKHHCRSALSAQRSARQLSHWLA